MKAGMTILMSVLIGVLLAGCASIPDEGLDNPLWSSSPKRGLTDPDSADSDP